MGQLSYKILVIDDDREMRESLEHLLTRAGWRMESARRGNDALQLLHDMAASGSLPDVILSDVRMPGMSGLELLEHIHGSEIGIAELPVVLISAHGDIPMAVDAMQAGAYSFVEKPFNPNQLLGLLQSAAREMQQRLENARLRARLLDMSGLDRVLLGQTAIIAKLREHIKEYADSDFPVLLLGQTGTGKELVARALHDLGARVGKPFVAINCAAIPLDKFEEIMFGVAHESPGLMGTADGGTLFLDEIAACSMEFQAKLLRVIETGEFCPLGDTVPRRSDFRVISASNEQLDVAVEEKKFRKDLWYRLNNVVVSIPSLSDRLDDIVLLFKHFLAEHAEVYEIVTPELNEEDLAALLCHDWPGNVRELRNVAERRVLAARRGGGSVSEAIQPDLASDEVPETLRGAVAAFEKQLISQSIVNHQGRMDAVAEALGIGRRTLNEKIVKLGLNKQELI